MAATVCIKHLELEFLLLFKAVMDFYFVMEVWVDNIPQYFCACILLPTTAKGVVEYHTQGIRFGRRITLEQEPESRQKKSIYHGRQMKTRKPNLADIESSTSMEGIEE